MKSTLLILLIIVSFSSYAEETLCNKIESKGEGHWPIPEKAFTKERANQALEILSNFTNKGTMDADYVSAENELIFIKGYMLKTFLRLGDKEMLKEFCAFIETEAYARH